MEFKYLKTFKAIVTEGSFVGAAEKLNYTQSAITFHVQQLEQELSTPLFEKLGRRMVLTKAGEQLIPYVDEVLTSINKIRFFEEDLTKCQGDLRIGVAETQLCFMIPPILKQFHRKAPNSRLFLRSMNCYDIRDELMKGELDLGIFYEDVGGFGTNLTTFEMGSCPLVLVASPELKGQLPDFKTPDQHIPVTFIINEQDCIFRQIFEQYLRKNAIQLDHTIELWSIPTIKNLVASGLGISFLPEFTVREELKRQELAEIAIDIPEKQITAVIGHLKSKWVSPLMQEFMHLCRNSGQAKQN